MTYIDVIELFQSVQRQKRLHADAIFWQKFDKVYFVRNQSLHHHRFQGLILSGKKPQFITYVR